MGRHHRSFSIERDLGRWVDEEAERQGVNKSEFVNLLLQNARERYYRENIAKAVVDAGVGSATLGLLFVLNWFVGLA